MKTKLHAFLFLGFIAASLSTGLANTIKSTYIGPVGGNWSDPANWSPPIVPKNDGNQKFVVFVESEYPGMNLDIDVRLNKFKLTGDGSTVNGINHSLQSCATSLGVDFPDEQFGGGYITPVALTRNVIADLGNLADFSDQTLKTGQMAPDASAAGPGITSTIQFNNADIRATNGYIGIFGADSRIVDQYGHDALANLDHILLYGIFDVETGREFTTAGSFLNEGTTVVYSTGFIGPDAPATLVITGDYTGIGYPLDLGTFGLLKPVAPGPSADAKIVIRGRITNYDAASKTLHKSYFVWDAAGGRSATIQVMGGSSPFEIVTNEASLNLFGPKTGFRDSAGRDALRNLTTSARLLIGNRNFTTKGSFVTTSRLSIFGDTQFTVRGDLTVQSGFFQLSPLSAYAREGEVGFPTDPEFIDSNVQVNGNFSLEAGSELRFDFFDPAVSAPLTILGSAALAGSLQTGVEDISQISSADSFTVVTAAQITGQFSNVASGGRVDAYGDYDNLGNPLGDPVGTFLVSYNTTAVVLSDFQPASDAPSRSFLRRHGDQ
jgi:hypothetical protein